VRGSNTGKKINIFVGFRRQHKDNRALFEIKEKLVNPDLINKKEKMCNMLHRSNYLHSFFYSDSKFSNFAVIIFYLLKNLYVKKIRVKSEKFRWHLMIIRMFVAF